MPSKCQWLSQSSTSNFYHSTSPLFLHHGTSARTTSPMDQTRALAALAPFLALAKAATSPLAATELITQATSASHTFVFAELLHHPNIQLLRTHPAHTPHLTLLEIFTWGTWESYHATPNLPPLTPPQAEKLRLLSLLSLAASHSLTYAALTPRLGLASPAALEALITHAISARLVDATLDPARGVVAVRALAPLRDLAPGAVPLLAADLAAWSARCNAVRADLETQIRRVRDAAHRRRGAEMRAEKMFRVVSEAADEEGEAMEVEGVVVGRKRGAGRPGAGGRNAR